MQLASKDVQVDFILVGRGVDRPGPFMTPMFAPRVRKAPRQEKEKKKRKENQRKKKRSVAIYFLYCVPQVMTFRYRIGDMVVNVYELSA